MSRNARGTERGTGHSDSLVPDGVWHLLWPERKQERGGGGGGRQDDGQGAGQDRHETRLQSAQLQGHVRLLLGSRQLIIFM